MQTEELRRERRPGGEGEGDNAVLFCCGDPGAAWIILSRGGRRRVLLDNRNDTSLAMDRLLDQVRGQKNTVVSFFFNFSSLRERSCV